MSDKEFYPQQVNLADGMVEYFEGLVKYMESLGYEDPRDKRIAELEQAEEYARQLANNACMEVGKRDKRIDAVAAYVNCLDGLPGSPMWRIKTDILAALEKK